MNRSSFSGFPVARRVAFLAVSGLLYSPPMVSMAQVPTPPPPTPTPTPLVTPTPTATPTATPTPTPSPTPTVTVASPSLDYPIALTDGINTVIQTRRELGVQVLPGRKLTAELGPLKRALERIAPTYEQKAVSAKPFVYRGAVQIRPEKYAHTLNVATTAARFIQAVAADPTTKRFTVSLNKTPPARTADSLAGIDGVLATLQTITAPNSNRNTNVRVACDSINGTLLAPGDVFSVNDIVGERTTERGFMSAPVFENAKVVPGIGGGVSQITGTLFNVAALAGLEIKEVHPHSRPVAYLPLGRDATVAYGALDLKFVNNTESPIYIEYTFDGRRLRATILGAKKEGCTISLTTRVQHVGKGKINAQLTRTIKQEGQPTVKERLFSHAYRWEP